VANNYLSQDYLPYASGLNEDGLALSQRRTGMALKPKRKKKVRTAGLAAAGQGASSAQTLGEVIMEAGTGYAAGANEERAKQRELQRQQQMSALAGQSPTTSQSASSGFSFSNLFNGLGSNNQG